MRLPHLAIVRLERTDVLHMQFKTFLAFWKQNPMNDTFVLLLSQKTLGKYQFWERMALDIGITGVCFVLTFDEYKTNKGFLKATKHGFPSFSYV